MPDDRPVSPEERLREALRTLLYFIELPGGFTRAGGGEALAEAAAALSTPAGPSPEPVRSTRATPRLHVICADCEGWDATNVSCPHGCGVALKAPFVTTPGDDATTKEGR